MKLLINEAERRVVGSLLCRPRSRDLILSPSLEHELGHEGPMASCLSHWREYESDENVARVHDRTKYEQEQNYKQNVKYSRFFLYIRISKEFIS